MSSEFPPQRTQRAQSDEMVKPDMSFVSCVTFVVSHFNSSIWKPVQSVSPVVSANWLNWRTNKTTYKMKKVLGISS
jgi:hypothetical protein